MAAEIASQNAASLSLPAAHVIGKAFVEQYYHILHHSPDMVHKFYQDTSILGRPDLDGAMSSITTMQAINEKVMSLNYEDYKFEIETVDAQHSYKEGVIVLVTGCLSGEDNVRRKFTQSFFLAPQDKGGYFVLNDVFRYVGECQSKDDSNLLHNAANEFATNTPASPNPETTNRLSEEDVENGEVVDQLEAGESVVEEEPVDQTVQLSQPDAPPPPEVTTTIQEDAPKKSYASIVKVRGNSTPSTTYVPTTKAKVVPANTETQAPVATPVPALEAVPASKDDVQESSNPQEEVEGHSIYVRNLPLNATPVQVEEEFKKFGRIKPGGVQVRNHRQFGYCFGFVEFESENSMQAAIQASPVMMGSHRVVVETKRTTTRVVDSGAGSSYAGGRGQFPQGRGSVRNENRFFNYNFMAHGGFSGGQGYGRGEFRPRGGFSSRGRGVSSRGSRVYQNSGRNFRPTGMNQTALPV